MHWFFNVSKMERFRLPFIPQKVIQRSPARSLESEQCYAALHWSHSNLHVIVFSTFGIATWVAAGTFILHRPQLIFDLVPRSLKLSHNYFCLIEPRASFPLARCGIKSDSLLRWKWRTAAASPINRVLTMRPQALPLHGLQNALRTRKYCREATRKHCNAVSGAP